MKILFIARTHPNPSTPWQARGVTEDGREVEAFADSFEHVCAELTAKLKEATENFEHGGPIVVRAATETPSAESPAEPEASPQPDAAEEASAPPLPAQPAPKSPSNAAPHRRRT